MDRLTSIIVPVDFTTCSGSAVRQAIRIARWNQARLEVLHVVASEVAAELEAALGEFQQDVRSGLLEDARREWERLKADIPDARDMAIHVMIDHPIHAILQRAQDTSADLLVMGVHGTSRAGRGAGTVATACVRKSHSKVLLVHDGQDAPFKSIVACIDFSDTSLKALREAVHIALQDGAKLYVLHVFAGPWHKLHYRAPTPEASPDFQKQYTDGLRGRLESFCKPLATELGYLHPEYCVLDFQGYGDGITTFVGQHNCDLVVMGTKGKTNLRYMLWGRTAERVARDAPCSILVVKPDENA